MNKNELVRANVLTIEQMEERVEATDWKVGGKVTNNNGNWGAELSVTISGSC